MGAVVGALCKFRDCDVASRVTGSRTAGEHVKCASLKANMGHLEACAAAAGLASLLATPVVAGVVAVNAQLRRSAFMIFISTYARQLVKLELVPECGCECVCSCRLNAHVVSLLSSCCVPGAF